MLNRIFYSNEYISHIFSNYYSHDKKFRQKIITTKTYYVYVKIDHFQKKLTTNKKLNFFLFKHIKKKKFLETKKLREKNNVTSLLSYTLNNLNEE